MSATRKERLSRAIYDRTTMVEIRLYRGGKHVQSWWDIYTPTTNTTDICNDIEELGKKWREGWAQVGTSRKRHYFLEGESLCGGWFYTGLVKKLQRHDPNDMNKSANCKVCIKQLKKR